MERHYTTRLAHHLRCASKVGSPVKSCSQNLSFRPPWFQGGKRPDPFNEANIKSKNELVVCFGELLIDFVPTVGGLSLSDAPAFKKAPGGAPANVAVGIAKLGGNSAFVGKRTEWKHKVVALIQMPGQHLHL